MNLPKIVLLTGFVACCSMGGALGFYCKFWGPPQHRSGVDRSLHLRLGNIVFDTGVNRVSKQALRRVVDSPLTVTTEASGDSLVYYECGFFVLDRGQDEQYYPDIRSRGGKINPRLAWAIKHSDTVLIDFRNVFVKMHDDTLCHRVCGFTIIMR